MARLSLSHQVLPGAILIAVGGDLDAMAAGELEEYIRRVRQRPGDHLVFDMAEVPFIDSTGLRVLVNALVYARRHRGSVRLARLQLRSLRVLELTQLDTTFTVHVTVEEALEAALTADEHDGADPGAPGAQGTSSA